MNQRSCSIQKAGSPGKRRLYYGWVIVAVMGAAGGLSMALGTLNFGLFVKPMGDQLGIGRAAFGWAQTGRMVVGAFTSPLIGRLVDRFGSRILMALAAFISGAALFGVAHISQSWHLIALFSVMGTVAIGGPANLVTMVPVAKWFVRKRGRAMSVVSLGGFLGGVVFVPLTQFFIDTIGWRNAWMALAAIGAGLIIPLSLAFVRRQPEDMGLVPDSDSPTATDERISETEGARRESTVEISWSLQEAVHSATFWRLAFAFNIVALAVSSEGLHRIPNFIDRGLDPQLVAYATAMDTAAGGVVSFSMGFLTERIPARFLGAVAFSVLALATFLNIIGDSPLLLFLAMSTFGMGIGGMMFLQSYLWADYFGRLHLGSIRGFVMPMTLVSMGAGAPPGRIYSGHLWQLQLHLVSGHRPSAGCGYGYPCHAAPDQRTDTRQDKGVGLASGRRQKTSLVRRRRIAQAL